MPSVEKVQTLAGLLGRKLGLLLATAPLPEDEKQAWLAMLPEMTPEQLMRFSDLLEKRVLDAATAAIDAQWLERLRQFAAERSAREKQINEQATSAVSELERALKERRDR
ncbi:hypothetical protein HYZ80_03140 [Candidatus Parcubacteria bacterium]|nr:hypothetical protein [Candidatus Parcubacteria bacterium]